MAMYVYKDVERTIEIQAEDGQKEDIKTRYYCPNSKCEAHMYLCAVDGSSRAYFSANRKPFPHLKHCDYGSSNSFKVNNTDERSFDFQSALKNMMDVSSPVKKGKLTKNHKSGETSLKPLRTIRQIYDMCISYSCTREYNNQKIGQMLLDDRSEYMYPKGVFGNRIIKSNVKAGHFYNSQNQEIYLVAPSSKKYSFILKIQDKKLFRFIKDSLYNNQNKFVIVGGYWRSTDKYNVFQAEVSSKKQVKVLFESK